MTTASDAPDSAEITAQDDLAVRKSLGPFELKKKLGQGGMGAVYLAIDPEKKSQLALKVLPREKASNPQLVKRFKAEAQNASQLTHENIVGVYGAGEADGYLYIALEFIDGIDVHDLIQKRGVLPVKRSIDIIKQVTRALQHAFEQHIVHRDIKPANLLIRRDGVVKLADMGLARAVDESTETGITRAGTTVGTVDYMSPEQARNSKAADVRSDIYSLGCTWYHMLTGRPPFADGSLTNKLHAHAKQPPPDPRTVNPNVPEGVVAVMQRMMAKNPDERYQTPKELIKDLEGALVNKDAVSRKILEGIVEDFPADESADESSSSEIHAPRSERAGNPKSLLRPDSETYDADDAASESDDEDTPETALDDSYEVHRPAKRPIKNSQAPHKPTTPVNRTFSAAAGDDADDFEESEDPHQTLPPNKTVKAPTPAKQTSDGRSSSDPRHLAEATRANEATPRSSAVPAKVSGKTARSETPGASSGQGHTLPPPKRKTGSDKISVAAVPMSPKKILSIVGGIAAGILVLLILFPIVKKSLMGDEPLVVGTNPFDGAPPPPPPPTVVVNPIVPGIEPAVGVPQQTVKDVLVDRKDQLANAGSVSTGSRPSVGSMSAGTQAGSENRNTSLEWMDQPLQTTSAPIFNIRKGQAVESERQYPYLQDALKTVSRDGGRLVLFHEGPFELSPTALSGGIVSIEAAVGVRPRIRLVKDLENNKVPGLEITNGSLVLDGVDVICDADAAPADVPWTWFQVNGGHVYIKRSSMTLVGQRKGKTTAIKLSGKLSSPNGTNARFLLDETVVRGEGLQAAQLESPALDAVVRNSLIISGEANTLTLRNSQKVATESVRKLRVTGSTISSRLQVLTLSSTDVATPVSTEVVLEGSLLTAPELARQSVVLQMEDWPVAKSRMGSAGPFKNLIWSAEGSAALGFNSLLSCNTDASLSVSDSDAWKQLWKDSSEKASAGIVFSSVNWPVNVNGPLSQSDLKVWSLKTLETLPIVFSNSDHIPGCRISNLRVPDLAVTDHAIAGPGQRPRPPLPFPVKLTVPVDLNKTDLGKFISSKIWDDGTLFIASGNGTKTSSPIVVENRRIRVQFVQTEGPTLIINPKAGIRSGENTAFLTVKKGQLDIEKGSFAYDAKDAQSITTWFLNVEGGGFSLSNCRIVAPIATASRSKGLIRWVPEKDPPKVKSASDFAAFANLENSLLVGSGLLFSLEFADSAFVAKNCAFVSRQHLFEISSRASNGTSTSAFDAQECTYLVAGTQFIVQQASAEKSKSPSVRMFHHDCIFGTIQADAGKIAPVLMNVVGGSAAETALIWSEESCGYSPDLKTFHVASPAIWSGPASSQDFHLEWEKRWGPERVDHPLREPDGVVFEKSFSVAALQVKPENLTLHKSAKAKTWAESRGPLGVHAEALEPPAAAARSQPGGKKPTTPAKPVIKF